MKHDIVARIDTYLEKNWESMVNDIERLVCIPSVEELDKACENAPFGPGPRQALDAAIEIASNMGFSTCDVGGYLAYADFPGEKDTQIGIIGHVDVVPAGPGWTVPAFKVTRKEGFLLGRGVIDDKGPSVVALHAMNFWKEQGARFPYTVRFLFGANEESGMADVSYYRERFADPAFLFTPDAEFPVCYGEKGMYSATITSPTFSNGRIVAFEGGTATNAVPGVAFAVVRGNIDALPEAKRISREAYNLPELPGISLVRLEATGKSAHASLPEGGINAIGLLVNYLLENDLCTVEERSFLQFQQKLLSCTDGSKLGISASDEHFGALTAVGGTVSMESGAIIQTLDCRFPTSITADSITAQVEKLSADAGARMECTHVMEPFLVDPDSPVIQALLSAYNEATGENAQPFTMGGGTYARHFTTAASFGPEKPWESSPEWAGSMHGPDEAVSEQLLKQAFRIYALTLPRLMELKL